MPDNIYLNELEGVAKDDVDALRLAEKSYGNSWKKRGGIGAFMMLARKIDRIEMQAKKAGYDIFEAVARDTRSEGLIDDIRDLRRYLMLVEAELRASGRCPGKLAKDIEDGSASKGSTSRDLTNMMPTTGDRNFNIQIGSKNYLLHDQIGMRVVKYVRKHLGESVLAEVKIANGLSVGAPIPTRHKYVMFIAGLCDKIVEAYSQEHLDTEVLAYEVEDDTPPASVLHPQ